MKNPVVIPRHVASARVPHEPKLLTRPIFGASANTIRLRKITLDAARTNTEFPGMTGNFFWILDASSVGANADIKFDHDQGEGFPAKKGFFLSGVDFNKLIIDNAAQAGETITILYGIADGTGLQVGNPIGDTNIVTETKASLFVTFADVSCAAAAATALTVAIPTRRAAIISNLLANTQTMRIGDLGVGAAKGIPLAPGETIFIETNQDIYAFNPGAGAESLAVTITGD